MVLQHVTILSSLDARQSVLGRLGGASACHHPVFLGCASVSTREAWWCFSYHHPVFLGCASVSTRDAWWCFSMSPSCLPWMRVSQYSGGLVVLQHVTILSSLDARQSVLGRLGGASACHHPVFLGCASVSTREAWWCFSMSPSCLPWMRVSQYSGGLVLLQHVTILSSLDARQSVLGGFGGASACHHPVFLGCAASVSAREAWWCFSMSPSCLPWMRVSQYSGGLVVLQHVTILSSLDARQSVLGRLGGASACHHPVFLGCAASVSAREAWWCFSMSPSCLPWMRVSQCSGGLVVLQHVTILSSLDARQSVLGRLGGASACHHPVFLGCAASVSAREAWWCFSMSPSCLPWMRRVSQCSGGLVVLQHVTILSSLDARQSVLGRLGGASACHHPVFLGCASVSTREAWWCFSMSPSCLPWMRVSQYSGRLVVLQLSPSCLPWMRVSQYSGGLVVLQHVTILSSLDARQSVLGRLGGASACHHPVFLGCASVRARDAWWCFSMSPSCLPWMRVSQYSGGLVVLQLLPSCLPWMRVSQCSGGLVVLQHVTILSSLDARQSVLGRLGGASACHHPVFLGCVSVSTREAWWCFSMSPSCLPWMRVSQYSEAWWCFSMSPSCLPWMRVSQCSGG